MNAHVAFTTTSVVGHAGGAIKLRDNTGDGREAISALAAGVNGKINRGTHTVTLVAQDRPWYVECQAPCDPSAMKHSYMMGHLTVI